MSSLEILASIALFALAVFGAISLINKIVDHAIHWSDYKRWKDRQR